MKGKKIKTSTLAGMALLTAMVIVLQLLGSFIRFGMFSVSLVLLPIVIGAALYGPGAGAWFGLVFGGVVLLGGDAAPFLAINPIGTILTVLIKGALAGLSSALIFRLLNRKSRYGAAMSAALVCPLVNTGCFLLGCWLFFMPKITEWAMEFGFKSAAAYMFLGLAGGNFLFEVGINLLLAPVIIRLLGLAEKGKK